jgi:hypothetical protein
MLPSWLLEYIFNYNFKQPYLWSSGQSSRLQNGDALRFLWGTNSVYICYVEESRPPLWSSGQSSWLQNQRFGFLPWHYRISWEVVGLKRGPLSLVSTNEAIFGRKISSSDLESREYGRRDSPRWPLGTFYLQKLALSSPTRGGRSVRSRTHSTKFSSVQTRSKCVRNKPLLITAGSVAAYMCSHVNVTFESESSIDLDDHTLCPCSRVVRRSVSRWN